MSYINLLIFFHFSQILLALLGESLFYSFNDCMLLLLLLSHFSRVRLCATPETAAHQIPPSLGFSRQEHWSGLPFNRQQKIEFR